MKDEIKEIFKTKLYFDLDDTDYIKIQNYITNLQEEYEKEHYLVDKLTRQLNDEYKNTEYQCKQKEDYKSRCEKADKFIDTEVLIEDKYDGDNTFLEDLNKKYYKNLKNILNGDDKE